MSRQAATGAARGLLLLAGGLLLLPPSGSARIVLQQTPRGPVWTNVPEPAGTRLPKPCARRLPYAGLISDAAQRHGVDARLVEAIVACESDFEPDAVSSAGAEGLMQLMPETQKELGVTDAFDVGQNLDGGARHLAGLIREFGSNWKMVAAAYNAGAGAVRRAGGIPPYPETVHYVRKVQHYLQHLGVDLSGQPVTSGFEAVPGVSFTGIDDGTQPAPEPDWFAEPVATGEVAAAEEIPRRPRGPRPVMVRDERGRVTFTNTGAALRGASASEGRR